MVLRFFGTDAEHYTVVFTSGATAALRLVGEAYRFRAGAQYVYLRNNHNSVVGVREYALARGANFSALSPDDLDALAAAHARDGVLRGPFAAAAAAAAAASGASGGATAADPMVSLLAVPAQDNFDGTKYGYARWVALADAASRASDTSKWRVLLDAAALVGTSALNLTRAAPDYVALSFYKMVGWPTGLGALLVRNDAFLDLQPRYWGGGQVRVALAEQHYRLPAPRDAMLYEAGTLDFHGVAALAHALPRLAQLGMPRVQHHVRALTRRLHAALAALRHANGRPVCTLYGRGHTAAPETVDGDAQGGVVALNVRRADGRFVAHADVLRAARARHISVRTGCMCNPGACFAAVGLAPADVAAFARAHPHTDWDGDVVVRGTPVGAVRVSLGYPTTVADVDAFVAFIRDTYTDS